jgi:hypothetical protein
MRRRALREKAMTAATISPNTLVGQTFDCVFGAFVPRLTFKSTEQLRVQALIGGAEIDQLQDHENGVVHNHARLADGQVFRAEGRLQPVPQA